MCRDLFQHPVGAGSLRSCLEGFTEGSRGAAGLGSIPGARETEVLMLLLCRDALGKRAVLSPTGNKSGLCSLCP